LCAGLTLSECILFYLYYLGALLVQFSYRLPGFFKCSIALMCLGFLSIIRNIQSHRNGHTVHSSKAISPQIGSMVLIKRQDGLIDLGKCIDVSADTKAVTYTVYSQDSGKWVENSSVTRTCTLSEVLYSGFQLTGKSQLRSRDRKVCRSMGWDL